MRIQSVSSNYRNQSFGISEEFNVSKKARQASKFLEEQAKNAPTASDILVKTLTAKNADEALIKLLNI